MSRKFYGRTYKKPYIPHVPTTEITAYFDGACWPNSPEIGHAAAGAVILKNGEIIHHLCHYMGCGGLSNNCAEYGGLLLVLKWFMDNGVTDAAVYGDNDMVINQISGQWGCREPKEGEKPKLYKPFYEQAIAMRLKLPNVTYHWIPRDLNDEADRMSRTPLWDLGLEDPDL